MGLHETRRDLENDRDQLQTLADSAATLRSQVYDFQTEANGLVLDNVELSEGGLARELEDEADAMAGHIGEAYELVTSLLQQAENLLTNLPDEEPCEECGELIPEDEIGQATDAHAPWCPELDDNKED